MNKDELVSGFILELRRGTVVLCVLAKLKQATYGYNLIPTLAESGIAIEANTLYPLLRRLESQGLLTSEWNTEGPKPRKYYQTTEEGQAVLHELVKHWEAIVSGLNTVLGENDHEI